MEITKNRFKQIIKEELTNEARSVSSRYDPFTGTQDDFEAFLDKYSVQDPIAVLGKSKDRWETMLVDQREADQAEGYI